MAVDRNADAHKSQRTSTKVPSSLDTYLIADRDTPVTHPGQLPHSKIKQCQSPFPFQSPRVQRWGRNSEACQTRPEARIRSGGRTCPGAARYRVTRPALVGDECCQESRGYRGRRSPLWEGNPLSSWVSLTGTGRTNPPLVEPGGWLASPAVVVHLSAMLPSY